MAFGMAGLEYVLKLRDQMTAPIKGIMGQFDALAGKGKAAMGNIAAGAAGIVAAGYSIASGLQPALETSRALGEVKSLGVAEQSLEQLKNKALSFTSSFGGAAAEFVRSAYDIQSAIAGLNGDELSAFTAASNLLAKGTKSTAATITNYMGTMYGIFADEAAKIGKSDWVDKIAGQTALAVKMFKTDGSKMAQAFSTLGASAKAAGVEVAEQFAVLGALQATMGGGESATQYKAFLAGVGKAQKKLGLTFTDSNGRMLDMVTILQRIKDKYGDLSNTASADLITSAFGSDQATALIKLLIPQVRNLTGNIKDLRNVSGTADLQKMAQAMTDPWQRLSAIMVNIKDSIGGQVLKKIEPLANKIADMGKYAVDWLNANKYIARLIGFIGIGITALAGAGASLMLLVGAFKLMGVGAKGALLPITSLRGALVGVGASGAGLSKTLISAFTAPVQPIKTTEKWASLLKNAFGSMWGSAVSGFNGLRWRLALLPDLFKSILGNGISLKSMFTGVGSGINLLAKPLNMAKSLFANLFSVAFRLLNPFTYLRLVVMALFSPLSMVALLIGGVAMLAYKFKSQLAAVWDGIKIGFGSISDRLQPLSNAFAIFKTAIGKIADIFSRITGGMRASSAEAGRFVQIGMVIGNVLGTGLEIVAGFVELLATQFLNVVEIFGNVADDLLAMWDGVVAGWEAGDAMQIFGALAQGITNIFGNVWKGVKKMFFDSLNWIIRQVNKVGDYIGIKIPEIKVESSVLETKNSNLQLDESVKPNARPQINTTTQGLISTAMTQNKNVSHSMVINKMEIKSDDPDRWRREMQQRQDRQALGAGYG
ncbi:phage tail tape measure protein [Gallibacterium anatis]|uniref:phage tail tape measure protein n=1 Tax=Gallibacterium anatis TaxID=750 RepID=UPI002550C9B5|nr:phage tail tape measure protein [Gallibacterium anatis]WIM82931.1 phage tail tape measure protein [Gallibacterium anatis]